MTNNKNDQQSRPDPFTQLMFGPPPPNKKNNKPVQGGQPDGILKLFTKPDGTLDLDEILKIAEQLAPLIQKAAPILAQLFKSEKK